MQDIRVVDYYRNYTHEKSSIISINERTYRDHIPATFSQ